jgi:hypothetical protein
VNSYNELCTWKIEAVVEESLKVIASGNLIEIETFPFQLVNDYGLDARKAYKKHHYFMPVPTCASNIGIVIGNFDTEQDDNIGEISYFFEAPLKNLLKDSTSFMNEIFEFFEDTLSFQFPYNTYKQVFVPDALEEHLSFASLTILR